MDETGWTVIETEFDPTRLHHKETVFTLGNGFLGTRGAFEEGYPGGAWPATLIHGLFDDVPVAHTELANAPNWLPLVVFVEGELFRLDRGQVLRYQRQLDLRRGRLSRDVRWRSPAGQTLDLHFERFASLADQHLLALRCQVTPLDFEGEIRVEAGLNGYPDNQGVMHWHLVDQGVEINQAWLHTCTRGSGLELGMAAWLAVHGGEQSHQEAMGCDGLPTLVTACQARPDQTITATKLVSVYTSRDLERWPGAGQGAASRAGVASENLQDEAQPTTVAQAARQKLDELLSQRLRYEDLLAAHQAAWTTVWQASDVVIEGDPKDQLAVRYNLFQILIAAPRYDDRVSIPAKTLSGFGYRGHVFWDTEIFIVPFLTFTQPALARHLLTYRYHTLPGARRKARAAGYEGAMFAWESADTGDEVAPRWVPGPDGEELVRIWCGDIELHISADVAYAIWRYWQATGDDDFMRRYGAEIILDTAVFWGDRAEWNAELSRYEVNDVIGPDEYHEHVDNNAFTNAMLAWHLETARQTLAWLRQIDPDRGVALTARLGLTPERLAHWDDVRQRIFIPHDPETGLIEQFDGFFQLEDIDLGTYEPRLQSMQTILGIEGANQRQVLKQADVLMLLYLLHDWYDLDTLQTNWGYYNPRTDHTHGSSLSPAIHAALASELGQPEEAYEHFMRAALVDLEDLRGNTADGIHAASAGALWQAVVFGFGGIRLTDAGPVATPRLPPGWTRLKFRLHWRGQWYDFDLRRNRRISKSAGGSPIN